MDESRVCWVCRGQFAGPFPEKGDNIVVDCCNCGDYTISKSLRASTFPQPDSERHRLSFWSRQRQLEGREPASFTVHSIDAILAQLPDPPTHAKADILLRSLTLLHPKPGTSFKIDSFRSYSLAAARDEHEMAFHIARLQERHELEVRAGGDFRITGTGWERAATIAERESADSKTAFVAMWFSNEMLAYWEAAFKPAIARAGFEPRLASDPQHNERIDAHIIAELKQCRFVVADVTGARTGVYFEAGYALGERKPVIWTCKSDHRGDMHFDTRQYNHILWSDGADLKEQLYYRIVATI